jgi:peptidoglycan LD-endopeptidase LytH
VRKAPVIPAAILAATFAFTLPGESEARAMRQSAPRTASVSAKSRAPAARVRAKTRRPSKSRIRSSRSHRAAARRVATPTRIVRPDSTVTDVIDRIEIVESFGPFLPVELHDYPRPPCPASDPILLTAALHEPDSIPPESPETDIAESMSIPPRLARLARRFGSLFRPKSSVARVKPQDVDLAELLSGGLQIPVEGVDAGRLRDSFLEARGKHARHLAIDIGAPRGTPILATADGEILRLTREARGGISIYQKDASGRYLFFYCHLSRYAEGLEVGQKVSRGEVIGYVGSTGRVRGGPHLHFSMTRLPEDDDNFREGLAINPYLLFLAGVP